MAYDSNNIFAKILRGELPSHKVYEDADTLAFMDIMPRCEGHTLVIPKTPARNLLDASPAQLAACMKTAQKVAAAVMKAFGADGITLQQFNEAAGGQVVFHLHFHVMPRWEGVALGPAGQQDGEARGARRQRREDQEGAGGLRHQEAAAMAAVLVIGASRGIGLETVKRALAAGPSCAGASPAAAAALPLDDANLEKVAGDALDPAQWRARCAGMDAVIQSLGAPSLQSLADRHDLFSKATRILIDAMQAAGVAAAGGRHRPRRRRQPRPRRLALRCPDVPAGAEAHLRRQGRAGADDPRQRAGLDHRPAGTADQRRRRRGARARSPTRRTGAPGRSAAPTSPISWCARPSSAASSARRRC